MHRSTIRTAAALLAVGVALAGCDSRTGQNVKDGYDTANGLYDQAEADSSSIPTVAPVQSTPPQQPGRDMLSLLTRDLCFDRVDVYTDWAFILGQAPGGIPDALRSFPTPSAVAYCDGGMTVPGMKPGIFIFGSEADLRAAISASYADFGAA